MSTRLRADLALVAVAFIWGAAFVAVKRALDDVSSVLFLTLRFSLAAFALALYFRRGWLPQTSNLAAGFVVGTCLAVGYALQTLGLETTSVANSGFITGFYIPLVPVIGSLYTRRMPARMEALGVLIASLGIGLLTWPEGSFGSIRSGDLLTLAGAFAFAIHILALGHFLKTVPHTQMAFTQIAVAALFGCATFWWVEPVRIVWTSAVLVGVAVTALFATALAFAVQSWAQTHTTPTRAALIFALEPVFAWLAAYVMYGELLTVRAALGAAAVLAGILLVELKPAAPSA